MSNVVLILGLWYDSAMEKICRCGKKYNVIPSRYERNKYCSKKCFYRYRSRPSGLRYKKHKDNPTSFKKGNIPWNKGKSMKHLWKDDVGYDAIHEWVERWVGKKDKCESCGGTRNLELSNISGEYKRKYSDWQTLCKKCHCAHDYEKFGAREKFYKRRIKNV